MLDVFIYIKQCFYSNRNGCKVLKHICERVTIFGMQKRGTFSVKTVDIKVRGWTLGLDYPLTPGRITKQSDPLRDLRL